jgi:sec-independent protein translocase protein TatA
MGSLSAIHWLIIAAIVFLLFGNRLPSVMRSLGQGVVEFKKGLQGIEDDVKNSANNSSKIEEQPSKPQAKPETEHGSADAAPR